MSWGLNSGFKLCKNMQNTTGPFALLRDLLCSRAALFAKLSPKWRRAPIRSTVEEEELPRRRRTIAGHVSKNPHQAFFLGANLFSINQNQNFTAKQREIARCCLHQIFMHFLLVHFKMFYGNAWNYELIIWVWPSGFVIWHKPTPSSLKKCRSKKSVILWGRSTGESVDGSRRLWLSLLFSSKGKYWLGCLKMEIIFDIWKLNFMLC